MADDGNPFQSPTLEGIRGSCTSDCVVEFDYSLEDGTWFALKENTKFHQSRVLPAQILFSFFALFFGAMSLLVMGSANLLATSVPLLLIVVYFIYRAVSAKRLLVSAMRKQLEAMLSKRSNNGTYGRTTVRLEENGLTVERPGGRLFWCWWAVPEIVAADGYLLVYLGSVEAQVIPARAFLSDEYFDSFVSNALRLWNTRKDAAVLATPVS